MKTLLTLLVSGIAVLLSAYIVPGVTVDGFGGALIVAVVLGLVNTFIEPLVLFLTLPLNILTLGLFTLVVSAMMVMITSALVPGFTVAGIGTALLFSIALSVINAVLFLFMPPADKRSWQL